MKNNKTQRFSRVSRISNSDSTLIAYGLGESRGHIEIRCAHECPDTEKQMIKSAVNACNTHDELVEAIKWLLDNQHEERGSHTAITNAHRVLDKANKVQS